MAIHLPFEIYTYGFQWTVPAEWTILVPFGYLIILIIGIIASIKIIIRVVNKIRAAIITKSRNT